MSPPAIAARPMASRTPAQKPTIGRNPPPRKPAADYSDGVSPVNGSGLAVDDQLVAGLEPAGGELVVAPQRLDRGVVGRRDAVERLAGLHGVDALAARGAWQPALAAGLGGLCRPSAGGLALSHRAVDPEYPAGAQFVPLEAVPLAQPRGRD